MRRSGNCFKSRGGEVGGGKEEKTNEMGQCVAKTGQLLFQERRARKNCSDRQIRLSMARIDGFGVLVDSID